VSTQDVQPAQHFTRPPPRYTEASLIKALEELGIGRPSTYAPTLRLLQVCMCVDVRRGWAGVLLSAMIHSVLGS